MPHLSELWADINNAGDAFRSYLWRECLEDCVRGGLGLELGLATELAVVLLQLKCGM